MKPRHNSPHCWGEVAWLVGGFATTIALLWFIVTGAFLGWFG